MATGFPYMKYYPQALAKLRRNIENGASPMDGMAKEDHVELAKYGIDVNKFGSGLFGGLTAIPYDWDNIDYEMHLRLENAGWPELNEAQKGSLLAQAQQASQVSEAARDKRQNLIGAGLAGLVAAPLSGAIAAAPGIGSTGGAAIASGMTAPLYGGNPWEAALMGGVSQAAPGVANEAVNEMADLGINSSVGNILASAGLTAASGGDPVRGAILSGMQQILPNLPGDMGEFFKTDFGKLVSTQFLNLGGMSSGFTNWLSGIGISGEAKDVLEQILGITLLTGAGKMLAKDAIKQANALEHALYNPDTGGGLLTDMVATAKNLSSPEYMEKMVQEAQEDVVSQYANERKALESDLYARGLGEYTPGPGSYLHDAEARAKLEARRDIELGFPTEALQAQSAVAGVVQNAAQSARDTANEQMKIPFDLYQSYLEGRREDPYAEYLKAQTAQMQAAQQAAAPAVTPTTPQAITAPYDLSQAIQGTSGMFIPEDYSSILNQTSGMTVNTGSAIPQVSSPANTAITNNGNLSSAFDYTKLYNLR